MNLTVDVTDAVASFWKSNSDSVAIDGPHPKYLVVGEILRPHGVRGEVRTRVLTDYPEQLVQLNSMYLGDSPDDAELRKHTVNGVRFNNEYLLLKLEGYGSRNDAELLRNKKVMIAIDQAVPLEDGEYYLFQLIGLKVIADEEDVGRVQEVLQTGANDVYVVASEKYGEILIPAHEQTIEDIDFDARVITMSLPEGLLPPD